MACSNKLFLKLLTSFIICFFLFFNFIPKNFAFTVNYPNTDTQIDCPDFFNDYNFVIWTRFVYNKYNVKVALIDKSNSYYVNPGNNTLFVANSDTLRLVSSSNTISSLSALNDYISNLTLNSFTTYSVSAQSSCWIDYNIPAGDTFITNSPIYNGYSGIENNDILINSNVVDNPKFDNPVSDIENLQFSYILISPNDYGVSEPLYLHRLEVSYIVPVGNTSTYYYSDKIFRLDSSSPYCEELGDSGSGVYYYGIPFYKFEFLKDSQYVLFLSSSSEGINNSNGPITSPFRDDIFQLVNIDTTNKLTDNQVITSFYQNNSDNTQDIVDNTETTKDNTDDIKESTQNIEGFLTDGSVSSSTQSDIDSSLNFDNNNSALNNQNSGFFTRLTSLVSSLATYNLGDDTSITIPLPNSHGKTITLHSQDIYNGVNGTLRSIINAFWLFVFMFYLWRFINKIYIAVSTGNILDTFSSSGEAITQSML